jgi:general stress protein YciG
LSREKGKVTVEEAGRKGGLRTSETHVEEFYSEIGRKGGRIGARKVGKESANLLQHGKSTSANRHAFLLFILTINRKIFDCGFHSAFSADDIFPKRIPCYCIRTATYL